MGYDVDNHVLYEAAFLAFQIFHFFMELLFTMLIFESISSLKMVEIQICVNLYRGMKA